MVKNKILFLFLFPPPPEKILEKIREPNNKKSLALRPSSKTVCPNSVKKYRVYLVMSM
jgi:5'(3')-deoxyribonucleotidase